MRIAIAGYGQEGESSYKYWSGDPSNQITIVDQKEPTRIVPDVADTIIGEEAFSHLDGFDLVVRTAGLSPRIIKTDGKIWSATNEFFSKCPAQIVGVTGTKGKGTTASLITSILEAAGKKVWLLGNIGIPALDYLSQIQPSDVVVYELSSFQLWDLEYSPHIAVVLRVEPEHLDVHDDFADYVNAKTNIRRYQKPGDFCIFYPTNQYSRQIANSINIGTAYPYGASGNRGVYEKNSEFYENEQKICSVKSLQLIGGHNVENACAAISVAKLYDVSNNDIEKGLTGFKGLPHRLEFVREIDGVKYYNDSFSSSVPATVAAIKSFTQPEILIIGGIDRGGDFAEMTDEIANHGNIKAIIVIGLIRDKLRKMISEKNPRLNITVADATTMSAIVDMAKSRTEPGDVVILSPGCASFDMFKNFYDRGDQFKEEVNKL
ncbi:MAG: UDP-N-acetylmuramoyl-L-alanine--D-glutamate ligase [Candidatus Saccharimonadales bacterium]